MQRKRNQYAAIILVFLLAVAGVLYSLTREQKLPEINHDYFQIGDTEKIDRVTIRSTSGTIELKFENNRWRVNQIWDADAQMVKVLFATLQQMEPKRPVAASLKDSVRTLLETKGIHIALFVQGNIRAAFLAGGNALKTEAWMMKEGDTQPYVTVIPGYRVYVSGILEMEAHGWRNKRLFDFNWRNFKSLTASYPGEKGQGFEIELKGGMVGIHNMETVDTAKLNNYLDAVSLLFATRFVTPGQKGIDSLVATIPAARIEIKDIGNHAYQLELFSPRRKDVEIYGRMADGQIVALSKTRAAAILKKREYFLVLQ